jgi:hypothetical protein
MVKTATSREVIVTSEKRRGASELERTAETVRGRVRTIDFARHGVGRQPGHHLVRGIAVNMRLAKSAVIESALERSGLRQLTGKRAGEEREFVVRRLRRRKYALPSPLE